MRCKKCNSEVKVNIDRVLMSNPPKYTTLCDNCGIDYITCDEYNKVTRLQHYEPIVHNVIEYIKEGSYEKAKESLLQAFV